MPKFNLDAAYKQGAEYQELAAGIRAHHPSMPEALIDIAIVAHKTTPKLYKTLGRCDARPPPPKRPDELIIPDAVEVLDPPAPYPGGQGGFAPLEEPASPPPTVSPGPWVPLLGEAATSGPPSDAPASGSDEDCLGECV